VEADVDHRQGLRDDTVIDAHPVQLIDTLERRIVRPTTGLTEPALPDLEQVRIAPAAVQRQRRWPGWRALLVDHV
jgi:hypothetical protein